MTSMYYHVLAFTVEDDEEGSDYEMEEERHFPTKEKAMAWCWQKMEEGFQTRMFRRMAGCQ